MATKKKQEAVEQIKVTLIRSTIGCTETQKATVAALGLKKIRSNRVHTVNPAIMGQIGKVNHLVKVEKI